jgi:UDP-glucuronate 4-epimerase
MEGKKILVTGPTGQVALPITLALARDNDVWGVARFTNATLKAQLEEAGVTCVVLDLADGDLGALPSDFDYVLNLAVVRNGDDSFDYDIAANCEGTGLLMQHCRNATAFLQCSSTAVYQPAGHHLLKETDALGDNHRVMMATYSICKIAAEAVARTGARQFGLPTTIARLNVPYGDNGGWPAYHLEFMLHGMPIAVSNETPNLYNPIHEDDLIEQVPKLLDIAGVPATIVNWAGREQTSIEEWCAYLGELTGLEPKLEHTDQTLTSVTTDNTKMHELVGDTKVGWREGMKRMVQARHPELLKG